MRTETIPVKNIKCAGCVSTIRDGLLQIEGVKEVTVDNGKIPQEVIVVYESPISIRDEIIKKLTGLGYPEAGIYN